jgi:hypothetical protein
MSGHGTKEARLDRPTRPIAAVPRFLNARTVALAAVLGLAFAAGAIILLRAGADTGRPSGTPTEASTAELRALAEKADAPIYWAGTRPGKRFELTRTRAGGSFVRYLPPGVRAGDKRAAFLTVATYPKRGAYAVTTESAHRAGMVREPTPGGGLAVWRRKRPSSVYLAYPGSDQLVEVFSPDAQAAQRLVVTGQVGPVAEVPAGEPKPRSLERPTGRSR